MYDYKSLRKVIFTLGVAFVVVLCNFLADALYRVMDPRLKGR